MPAPPARMRSAQGALRVELELELAGKVELLEQLVLADVGRDHLADLAAFQQQAEPGAVDPGVVGDHREVLDAGRDHGVDQHLGDAAQAEAARHDRHAVLEHVRQRGRGVGIDLLHAFDLGSPPLGLGTAASRWGAMAGHVGAGP